MFRHQAQEEGLSTHFIHHVVEFSFFNHDTPSALLSIQLSIKPHVAITVNNTELITNRGTIYALN